MNVANEMVKGAVGALGFVALYAIVLTLQWLRARFADRRKSDVTRASPRRNEYGLPPARQDSASHAVLTAPIPLNQPELEPLPLARPVQQVAERHWAEAYSELHSPSRNVGLWARAFATAAGDQAVAEASYLRWRAEEIHGAATHRASKDAAADLVNDSETAPKGNASGTRSDREEAGRSSRDAESPVRDELVILSVIVLIVLLVWAAAKLAMT